MITSANYFDEIETIIDRLPSEVKDAHNLVVAMKNDGIDDPFNTDDDDINDMGKLLLEKANAILTKSEGKAKVTVDLSQRKEKPRGIKITKPKAEPKRDTAILKKYNWDETHPIMILDKDSGQWKEAYDEFIAHIKKNPKGKAGQYELIETKKSTNTVDLSQRKTKKRVVKKSKPSKKAKTISKKTAQKVTRKAIKQTRKADAAKPSVTKKIFSKELQIVKAFIANGGKEVSVGVLKAKHAAAKNAVKDGKTNQHQETLRNIIVRYGKAIGAIKNNATHIKCNVEKGFLLKLKAIVADAKVKVRTDFLAGVDTQKLTLKEYLNQSEPSHNVEVYLKPSEVSIHNGHITTINIVDKYYLERFGKKSFTYRLKDNDNILYVVRDSGKHDKTVFRYDKPTKK